MPDPFVGEIGMFGFGFAPQGWAQRNGQLLPIQENTASFSLLGTTHGGDGRTTFALPDLRSRGTARPGPSAGELPDHLSQHIRARRCQRLPKHLPATAQCHLRPLRSPSSLLAISKNRDVAASVHGDTPYSG